MTMSYYTSSAAKKRRVPFLTLDPKGDAFDSSSKSKFNFSFYLDHPSKMEIRVSHYGKDPILHFTKGDRYLPMRETEFHDIIAMAEEISKKIDRCRKHILKGGKRLKKGDEDSFKIIKKSEKSAQLEQQ